MRKRGARDGISLVPAGIGVLACIATLSAIAWRMRRGLDWTDEAFYVSLPVRFIQGDRPFADEYNVAENAGLFLWPFLKVYSLFAGWEGVFLFGRVLFVAFLVAVAASVFAFARRCRLPVGGALVASAPALGCIPYGLPGLSYNTLGVGFLTIGTFVAARALVEPGERVPIYRDRLFWAGVALGSSTLAYPTLVVPAAFTSIAVLALAPERIRGFLTFCGGGLTVGVAVAPLLIRAGLSNLKAMAAYCLADRPPSSPSLRENIDAAWTLFQQYHPELWRGLALVAVAVILARRFPLLIALLVPLLPFVFRTPPLTANVALKYYACFALLTPIIALAIERRRVGLVVFATIFVPAVAAAFAVSLSSGNGARSAGQGLYPAALASGVLLALWLVETSRHWTWGFVRPVAQFAPATFLYIVVANALQPDAVYRDGPLPALTAKMTSGPYRGIYTTPQKKRWLDSVAVDIAKYRAGKRITFYYDFPAGYIYADRPPHLISTWNFAWTPVRAGMESRLFTEKTRPGEYVFRFGGGWNPTGTSIDRVVKETCEPIAHGDGYTIYTVKAEGAPPVP